MHGQVERELSIKNLAILNKTLLRKWCSRFVCERNALWKQVNVGKYMQEEENRCTREVTETYGVGVWKAIRVVGRSSRAEQVLRWVLEAG